MAELDFRRIEITDKERVDRLLAESGFRGCEYTFGNNFVWRNVYNTMVCFERGFYFCRFGSGDNIRFTYPAGGGSTEEAIKLLSDHCAEIGVPLRLTAGKDAAQRVLSAFPEATAELDRDFCDYVYLAEDLAELKGKKYHAKRNHLNRFYENNWSFEPLTAENLAECAEMNERWRAENIDESAPRGKSDEDDIVRCSLKHFGELGYVGGVLRVDGAVQAFTFGESCAEDTFVVHVEKALRDYQGAYTAVNREFVRSLGGRYKYINREDDTGAENLRKAKLSYYPAFLEEKYKITFGG